MFVWFILDWIFDQNRKRQFYANERLKSYDLTQYRKNLELLKDAFQDYFTAIYDLTHDRKHLQPLKHVWARLQDYFKAIRPHDWKQVLKDAWSWSEDYFTVIFDARVCLPCCICSVYNWIYRCNNLHDIVSYHAISYHIKPYHSISCHIVQIRNIKHFQRLPSLVSMRH